MRGHMSQNKANNWDDVDNPFLADNSSNCHGVHMVYPPKKPNLGKGRTGEVAKRSESNVKSTVNEAVVSDVNSVKRVFEAEEGRRYKSGNYEYDEKEACKRGVIRALVFLVCMLAVVGALLLPGIEIKKEIIDFLHPKADRLAVAGAFIALIGCLYKFLYKEDEKYEELITYISLIVTALSVVLLSLGE